MSTPIKTRRSKPVATGRSSGLIARAQATLRGRKPPAKSSPIEGVVSALGSAKAHAGARTPSKKGIAGIVVGGLGVVAMTKRLRGGSEDATPRPSPPVEVKGADGPTPPKADYQSTLNTDSKGGIVEIPKEQILHMLRDRGDHDKAQQAEQQLPDQVDPEQHKDLLGQLGIDPKEILGGAGGKLGL